MAQTKLEGSNNAFPVGVAEVAARLGVKPQTVHTWRHRNLMPAPRWTVSGQPAWEWAEIETWAKRTDRLRREDMYTGMLALEGLGWEGSLEQMRTDRVADS
jgi:predicted DNA-binding transcriptional regulator AlpA